MPYLSILIFLPVVGAILVGLMRSLTPKGTRLMALIFSSATFLLSLYLFVIFDRSLSGKFQFREMVSWIPAIGSSYNLGVDGLSMPMVLLTAFLSFVSVFVSWKIALRVREYFIWLLLLEAGILGVFMSLDLILFFLFWEVELIPMYMLISIWGSGRKEYSATKFVIYTLAGSAFMLAGFLLLYFKAQPLMATGQSAFNMIDLAQAGLNTNLIPLLPLIFFFIIGAFLIKLPVFPFHTWLPDAHTDAPTAVSVMLAGILLKMGGYGMIRLNITLFPDVARQYAPLFIILAIVGILYGAAVTLRQRDLKKLIAYSSVSHMGYVLLGVFALSQLSLTGAVLQMVSHGLVTGLLFAMVGLVYEKTHNRDIYALGGLARQMPIITVLFSIAGLASLGLPGTSGFIAEFLVFLGSFNSTLVPGIQIYTAIGALGIVITAGYILYMLQKVFYGPPQEKYDHAGDATILERFYTYAFVGGIMLVGLYPAIVTDLIKKGIEPISRMLGS